MGEDGRGGEEGGVGHEEMISRLLEQVYEGMQAARGRNETIDQEWIQKQLREKRQMMRDVDDKQKAELKALEKEESSKITSDDMVVKKERTVIIDAALE